jgi:lantibiotic modifying enzyme
MTRPWEPLLHGTDRDRALEIVAAIAADTAAIAEPSDWRGLMGWTGTAVFLASAHAAGLADERCALDALERGLAEVFAGDTHLGLWNGAAGVRWALARLAAGDEASALLARLDRGIEGRLTGLHFDGHDLYSGLSGVLLAYADDARRGDRVLAHVLDHFKRIDLCSPERHGLGCAHGIAGVLGALACCRLHGRADDRLQPLMLVLLAALENADVSDQRIGWCRGDLGIAIALLAAARSLASDHLADHAVAVALAPLARGGGRWPVDASLCHGAAGLAHLYNRMYQATGDGRLGDHAHAWLCKTMAMQVPGTGVAGFPMRRTGPEPTWVADTSILIGASGVGLALLTGVTSAPPSWDRVLGADVDRPENGGAPPGCWRERPVTARHRQPSVFAR